MSILAQIEQLRKVAEAQENGDVSAHHQLLQGIRKLQTRVETPIETASRLNFQILHNLCLRIVIEKGMLQALVDKNGAAVTADDLSKQTNTDVLLISRVMRILTAIDIVNEVGENTYAANDVTKHEVQRGSIGAIKHHFDLDMAMSGKLVPYMRREGDNTIYQFAGEPKGNTTLFEYALGTPTIFGTLAINPEQKEAFDSYMASKRPPATMQQWFEIYPAAEQFSNAKSGPDDALIVDVGGGPGQELVGLRESHQELPGRYILQDLPITLDRIDNLPNGVEKMPHDFFSAQPIKGARAYFMRDIMHNWSDANCHRILSRLVEAMEPGYSTLLIDQYVLPTTGAELRAAEMDILMLLHTSGIQRTVPMWERLLGGAGLEIIKIWPSKSGSESVIEAKRK